jgi:DNA invertase Pin-like site-specific DNA recombinase
MNNSRGKQQKEIEAWAKREDVTIVASFEGIGSGLRPLDPLSPLVRAIEACGEYGADVLVVCTADRITRDSAVWNDARKALEKTGARFAYVFP